MSRIAVVGDATSVAGFRPLGFATFAVERPEEARELWPRLSSGEFGVVFVTEPVDRGVVELDAKRVGLAAKQRGARERRVHRQGLEDVVPQGLLQGLGRRGQVLASAPERRG